MEILALYKSNESLVDALTAGARHLAAAVEGFALVYAGDSPGMEPDGWSGFTCAQDAQTAGSGLDAFRREVALEARSLSIDPPDGPPRIWQRAAGGVFGFPLRLGEKLRGITLVGRPGAWPRVQNAEIESTLRQLALVLDHHALNTEDAAPDEPSEDLLALSEQLLEQDIDILRKEEQVARVSQENDDLLQQTAHELRTPLDGIAGQLVSLLSDQHDRLSEAGRETLRSALGSTQALLCTLQNILDLYALKRGELETDLQDVNLHEVTEEALFNVRDRARVGVELKKIIPPTLPKVRTDLGKLNQILFLLLENSVKFTTRGCVEFETRLTDDQLLFRITDTGIGIAPEDQPRIFDEFFRVDTTGGSCYQGAGLGLAIARVLAEQLGGAISVQSEIGRGSRFALALPVKELVG